MISLELKQKSLSHVLRVTAVISASAVKYSVAVLGLTTLIPNLQFPPELSVLVGGLGIYALSSILDCVAKEDLSDEEVLNEINNLVSGEEGKLVPKDEFFNAFQFLINPQRTS